MPRTLFIFAHGAGGHKDDRGMLALDAELGRQGVECVRFNFAYREAGSRRPDAMPVLEDRIRSVCEQAVTERKPDRVLIGGRSMGGRAATMLAADGFACDGLLLLSYPLHPAGKPEKLRDAHLAGIRVPVLCFNGTRDALCTRALMENALSTLSSPLPLWTQHWLEGADHSFHVLKSSGRTDAEIITEVGNATSTWLERLPVAHKPQEKAT